MLSLYLFTTVYEDAEDGDTKVNTPANVRGWFVYDSTPSRAVISNVYDTQKQSRVIQFTGSGTSNGEWHSVNRHLQVDLEDYGIAGNDVTSVVAFLSRGSGRVDDIMLTSQPLKPNIVFDKSSVVLFDPINKWQDYGQAISVQMQRVTILQLQPLESIQLVYFLDLVEQSVVLKLNLE